MENGIEYHTHVYQNLYAPLKSAQSPTSYELFNTSRDAFNWILDTHDQFIEARYGGVSINGSRSAVWYNNKGYHSMPAYLNQLNEAHLQSLLVDTRYHIYTNNHPLKLGEKELTTSSM